MQRAQEEAARKAELEKLRKASSIVIEYQTPADTASDHTDDPHRSAPVELASPIEMLDALRVKKSHASGSNSKVPHDPYATIAAQELEALRKPLEQCLNFLQTDIRGVVSGSETKIKKKVLRSRRDTVVKIFESLKEQHNAIVLQQTTMMVEQDRLERMVKMANIQLNLADETTISDFDDPNSDFSANLETGISPRASALRETICKLETQSNDAIIHIQDTLKNVDAILKQNQRSLRADHRGWQSKGHYIPKRQILGDYMNRNLDSKASDVGTMGLSRAHVNVTMNEGRLKHTQNAKKHAQNIIHEGHKINVKQLPQEKYISALRSKF